MNFLQDDVLVQIDTVESGMEIQSKRQDSERLHLRNIKKEPADGSSDEMSGVPPLPEVIESF